jgi:hypothetical protein
VLERRDLKPSNCPHNSYRWDESAQRMHCELCGEEATQGPLVAVCATCKANPCRCPGRVDIRQALELVRNLATCEHKRHVVGNKAARGYVHQCRDCGAVRYQGNGPRGETPWEPTRFAELAKEIDRGRVSGGSASDGAAADSEEKNDN